LQAEIDAAVTSGGISAPVTESEARALPYLQACIREGLRFWPPIGGLMPRVSASDEIICGVHVPAGTHVAWSPKAVMRCREVFGEDADVFRPERWLVTTGSEKEAERLAGMQSTVDLCFGYGRWGCLGRPIALLELNKMVVEVSGRPFPLLCPACLWSSYRGC
jgi:cytochrome P450